MDRFFFVILVLFSLIIFQFREPLNVFFSFILEKRSNGLKETKKLYFFSFLKNNPSITDSSLKTYTNEFWTRDTSGSAWGGQNHKMAATGDLSLPKIATIMGLTDHTASIYSRKPLDAAYHYRKRIEC